MLEGLRTCSEQIGWLFSTPKFDHTDIRQPTWWESLHGKGQYFSIARAELPIGEEDGIHLLYALQELNWTNVDAMGNRMPLSYQEIESFGKIRGRLSREELQILRQLSMSWISGFRSGEHPLSRPPLERKKEG